MALKTFEDKEFHGLVTFFKNVIIKSVGEWLVNGDIKLSATKRLYLDGGGDTWIEEDVANQIAFFFSSAQEYRFTDTYFDFFDAGKLRLQNEVPSATNPVFVPSGNDPDTGVSWVSANILSFIAGGISIIQANIAGALFPLGYQSTEQSIEPTNSNESGNTILPNTRNVGVVAPENGVNDWILLPSLSAVPIGHTIIICGNGASAFEMRTPSASNEKINDVNADGDTLEYACKDEEIITVTKLSATDGWVATAQSKLGAIVTAVVPD